MEISKAFGALALASTLVAGGCADKDKKCREWLRTTDNGKKRLSLGMRDFVNMADKDADCYCRGVSREEGSEWGVGLAIDREFAADLGQDVYEECFSQLVETRRLVIETSNMVEVHEAGVE